MGPLIVSRLLSSLPLVALACLALFVTAGCEDDSPLPPADPLPDTAAGRLPNSASFLMDGADIRIMNGLSLQLSDEDFTEQVGWCVDNRDDTIALYVTNRGDGTPPVTSFYVDDEYGGTVDPAKVAAMRARIEECRANELKVHLWVWSDDSGFGGVDDETHRRHLDHCIEHFDDLADVWCTGLELDEVFGDKGRVTGLTAALDERTDRPVAVHFTRLDRWDWAVESGADIWFGQYGFGHSPDKIRDDTFRALKRLDGRMEFWAFEYHLSSRSAEAKALGDAAISVPGCMGTGNGRNRRDSTTE